MFTHTQTLLTPFRACFAARSQWFQHWFTAIWRWLSGSRSPPVFSTIPTVSWPGCSNALPPSAYNWTRLSDMVSFGFAPVGRAFRPVEQFPACGCRGMAALRRQRLLFPRGGLFGAAAGEIQYRRDAAYRVLRPSTPANALFFVALGWMDAKTGFNQGGWVLLMVPAMSWLLISPVRMFAFKFQSFAFKGNEIRYIFIALAVVLLVALGIPAVPLSFCSTSPYRPWDGACR